MRLNVDETAVKRIHDLRKEQAKDKLRLRVRIEGGGCSGFQYVLELTDDELDENDLVFDDIIVTDDVSIGFLAGATISFEDKLMGAEFKIDNPNASSGCGCGSSFSTI
ncbi:MAG: iron-sulfur cluster assembly accessory protein [Alphaproteobacteria bacterium]|nr:iron-sulfur cluster assembly accessory protein [Alphaproteobacteria bacterium]